MSEETALLGESLILMVVGMGIVFAFLLLLVALLHGMSGLIARWTPNEITVSTAADETGATPDDVVVAIAAAVTRFRTERGGRC